MLKHQKAHSSHRSSAMFLNEMLCRFLQVFVNFQSPPKKVILAIFASIFIAFMEEWIWVGPHSAILKVLFKLNTVYKGNYIFINF